MYFYLDKFYKDDIFYFRYTYGIIIFLVMI